jgi:hypothetical protein
LKNALVIPQNYEIQDKKYVLVDKKSVVHSWEIKIGRNTGGLTNDKMDTSRCSKKKAIKLNTNQSMQLM